MYVFVYMCVYTHYTVKGLAYAENKFYTFLCPAQECHHRKALINRYFLTFHVVEMFASDCFMQKAHLPIYRISQQDIEIFYAQLFGITLLGSGRCIAIVKSRYHGLQNLPTSFKTISLLLRIYSKAGQNLVHGRVGQWVRGWREEAFRY